MALRSDRSVEAVAAAGPPEGVFRAATPRSRPIFRRGGGRLRCAAKLARARPSPMNDKADPALSAIMAAYVGRTGGLISALRAAQEKLGFLPPDTEAAAAEAFNLSRAEVKGVISFYSDFRREPAGRTVIRLCAAEACQAQGGRALEKDVEKRFALKHGATSAARDLTLERVYCLGLCSAGPAAMVGEKLLARATTGAIAACVADEARPARP